MISAKDIVNGNCNLDKIYGDISNNRCEQNSLSYLKLFLYTSKLEDAEYFVQEIGNKNKQTYNKLLTYMFLACQSVDSQFPEPKFGKLLNNLLNYKITDERDIYNSKIDDLDSNSNLCILWEQLNNKYSTNGKTNVKRGLFSSPFINLINYLNTKFLSITEKCADYYEVSLLQEHNLLAYDLICLYDSLLEHKDLEAAVYKRLSTFMPSACYARASIQKDPQVKETILKSACKNFSNILPQECILNLPYDWKWNYIDYHDINLKGLENLNNGRFSPAYIKNYKATRDISIISLGGSGEIGASCHIISYKNHNIMLDCGISPGKRDAAAYPELDKAFEVLNLKIDYIILSHAHADHIGGLPKAVSTWDNAEVFCSYLTKSFAKILYQDMSRKSDDMSEREIDNVEVESLVKDATLNKMKCVDFEKEIVLTKDISFKLHHAGHLPGAALIELNIAGFKIVYTGDFCRQNQSLISGCKLDTLPEGIDLLISEATYAADRKDNNACCIFEEQKNKMQNLLIKCVNNDKSILLPSFSLGRSQEILSIISKLFIAGQIPADYEIYVGGVAYSMCKAVADSLIDADYTAFFNSKVKKMFPFEIPNNKVIVIASSGGMKNGTISHIVADDWGLNLQKSRYQIVMGSDIDSSSIDDFQDNWINISYSSLSTHAFIDDIIETINLLSPKSVIFVHWGTKVSSDKEDFYEEIEKKTTAEIHIQRIQNLVKILPFDIAGWLSMEERYYEKKY